MSSRTKIRVVFFGTPAFSLPTLETLVKSPYVEVVGVVTQPDRPAGRGIKMRESQVKSFAKKFGLKIYQPKKIRKNPTFILELQNLKDIDLAVVIAFGQILPMEVLNIPRCGSVNLHASLLPRWRGAAPIQRALLAGDKETGVCLMKMEKGLDTGDVYDQIECQILPEDNFESLHDKLAQISAQLIDRSIEKLVSGELTSHPQSTDGVCYAHKVENNEGFIDWNRTAYEINNQLRAFDPVPGAYTTLNGKRLKLYKGAPKKSMFTESFAPGTILAADKGQFEIQCGMDILAVQELQLEGKKPMITDHFLRGAGKLTGELLK